MKRSDNWKNIFDPSTGYVRPRRPNGEWIENTNPYHAPGFCEGSAWQFTWYVPHDVKSLYQFNRRASIHRPAECRICNIRKSKLQCFRDNMGAYPINHGNETNMQAAYLSLLPVSRGTPRNGHVLYKKNIMEWVPETPIRETKIKAK